MASIALIVAALALVQSLFGVGLLVFGTPTLLLLGESFPRTLAILLPPSITLSLLQVWSAGGQTPAFARRFALWCLVPLVATLFVVLAADLQGSLHLMVALFLVAFVLLRVFPGAAAGARDLASRYDRLWMVTMGLVHGFSNLGGALLLGFAASRRQRKEDVRGLIAFCYVCFAGSQLAVLAIVTPAVFDRSLAVYASVAALVFVLVGQRAFAALSAPVFNSLLTAVAAAYAGLLGLRVVGVW